MERNDTKYLLNDISKASNKMMGFEAVEKIQGKCKLRGIFTYQTLWNTPKEIILQKHYWAVGNVGERQNYRIWVNFKFFSNFKENWKVSGV